MKEYPEYFPVVVKEYHAINEYIGKAHDIHKRISPKKRIYQEENLMIFEDQLSLINKNRVKLPFSRDTNNYETKYLLSLRQKMRTNSKFATIAGTQEGNKYWVATCCL